MNTTKTKARVAYSFQSGFPHGSGVEGKEIPSYFFLGSWQTERRFYYIEESFVMLVVCSRKELDGALETANLFQYGMIGGCRD